MTLSELFMECGGNAPGTDVTVDGRPVDRAELSCGELMLETGLPVEQLGEVIEAVRDLLGDLLQEVDDRKGLAWLRSLLDEHEASKLLSAVTEIMEKLS